MIINEATKEKNCPLKVGDMVSTLSLPMDVRVNPSHLDDFDYEGEAYNKVIRVIDDKFVEVEDTKYAKGKRRRLHISNISYIFRNGKGIIRESLESEIDDIKDDLRDRTEGGFDPDDFDAINNRLDDLTEDVVKLPSGKWANKGKDGKTHGEFDTREDALKQMRAMYSNGFGG